MTREGTFPDDQKFFSVHELKNKGLSQYKIRNLVNEIRVITRMRIIAERNLTFTM